MKSEERAVRPSHRGTGRRGGLADRARQPRRETREVLEQARLAAAKERARQDGGEAQQRPGQGRARKHREQAGFEGEAAVALRDRVTCCEKGGGDWPRVRCFGWGSASLVVVAVTVAVTVPNVVVVPALDWLLQSRLSASTSTSTSNS